MIAVARTSDVVIMMLEATKGEVQRSAEGGEGPLRGRMAWEECSAIGRFSLEATSVFLLACAKCKGCCLEPGCRACSCKHGFGQKVECVL